MMISGNERKWYPLLLSYSDVISVREHLKKLRVVEVFLPVSKEPVVGDEGEVFIKEKAWIEDIIFVRHTKSYIESLMKNDAMCSHLSFMTNKEDGTIITIDDSMMQLFIYAIEVMKEHVTLMKMSDNFKRMGRRCRILGGRLAGMEGVLRRVQNTRRVYIDLNGIITAQIDSMPRSYIEVM